MIQPYVYEDVATFVASTKRITFTFPPVPQGLTWTGNIAFSVALGSGPDLQGIVWTAYRNGTPVLTWQEFGVACDVQAVSHETVTVVGTYMGSSATLPAFEIHATWTGASDYAYDVLPAAPWVSGSNRGLVQVYNSNGPDAPLAVVQTPQGTDHAAAVNAASSSTLILGTPTSGHPYRLWELVMQITAGSASTDASLDWLTATIKEDTTSKVLLQGQVTTVPGSTDSCTLHLPMHGYTMADGAALQMTTSSYIGANANVTASVIYEVT